VSRSDYGTQFFQAPFLFSRRMSAMFSSLLRDDRTASSRRELKSTAACRDRYETQLHE
jgi:hypothetical protein